MNFRIAFIHFNSVLMITHRGMNLYVLSQSLKAATAFGNRMKIIDLLRLEKIPAARGSVGHRCCHRLNCVNYPGYLT